MKLVKDIVCGLVETYSTSCPFELCQCLGIKIIKSNLGCEIRGFFQRTPQGYEFIHINSEINPAEMKYICAHELGHAILHTDLSLGFFIENTLQVKNKYEVQADKFAAELLVNIDLTEVTETINIQQLSSILCVPAKLIKYKYNIDM